MQPRKTRISGGGPRVLVWLRADLRVRDNTALHHAAKDARRGVVAVFAICPDQWREHDWADAKVDFLLRNLSALSEALSRRNIALHLLRCHRFDQVPQALLQLARRRDCDALYFNDEYEINERRRDRATESLFAGEGLAVRRFTDQVVLAPGSVRTRQDEWYRVFTPFKRSWAEKWAEAAEVDCWPRPRVQDALVGKPDPVPSQVDGFDLEWGRPDLWPAGETQAARRLSRFAENGLERYAERRDLPAVAGTSTLSPYLTAGIVSPRQCLQAAVEANGGRLVTGRKGPATWAGELIWREFYKHLLIGFPRLSKHRPFRLDTESLEWNDDAEAFAAWCEGRTGFPLVDAAMRQLRQTGWMHNRLRMIVAMFLTKDLLLDWRRGERFFMRSLVDGDLAANNGGWQWSASTGTDAAPYFRIFNPTTQSRRYDPQGAFIRRFVPELAELSDREIHDPQTASRRRLDYPEPICDHGEARKRALAAWGRLQAQR